MTDARDSRSIETFTGKFISYDEPVEFLDFDVEDIAHALSQLCRYTGHTSTFYSVAEHAVRVCEKLAEWECDPVVRLQGLHHDDAEAYLGDVNKPLKSKIAKVYKPLQHEFELWLPYHLGIDEPDEEAEALIKKADVWALGYEAYYLLPSQGFMWHDLTGGQYDPSEDLVNHTDIGWRPEFAEMMYLTLHRVLS